METRRTIATYSHVGNVLVFERVVGAGKVTCSGIGVLITRNAILRYRVAHEETLGIVQALTTCVEILILICISIVTNSHVYMVLVGKCCDIVGDILLVETVGAGVTLICSTTEACKLSHVGILQRVIVGVVNIQCHLCLEGQSLQWSDSGIPVAAEDVHDILSLVILQLTCGVRDVHV